jgi:stalled ribosome alternative rescue factor ArfA
MAEEKKKKWVNGVVDHMHKGAFREKAEHAGKSTGAYAREHEDDSGKTGEQARLAERLMAMTHAHRKHSAGTKKIMSSMYGEKK